MSNGTTETTDSLFDKLADIRSDLDFAADDEIYTLEAKCDEIEDELDRRELASRDDFSRGDAPWAMPA